MWMVAAWMPAAPPSSRSVICGLEPLRLGPHQVHPQEHLGPVAGLGAAGPGVDGHEGVAVVVGPAEHRPQLERLEVGLGLLGGRADLVVELVVSASSASSIEAARSSACWTSSSNGLSTALSVFSSWMIALAFSWSFQNVGLSISRRARRGGPACRPSQRESRSWRIRSITPLADRFSSASTAKRSLWSQ